MCARRQGHLLHAALKVRCDQSAPHLCVVMCPSGLSFVAAQCSPLHNNVTHHHMPVNLPICLQAWYLLASRERRAEQMGCHCCLRAAVRRWQAAVLQSVQLAHIQHMRRQRLLARILQHWAGVGAERRRLEAAARAFGALAPRWHKLSVLKAMQQAVWEAHIQAHMVQWQQRRVLGAWGSVVGHMGRVRRLLAVRRARAARDQLRRCLCTWRLWVAVKQRQRLAEHQANMQVWALEVLQQHIRSAFRSFAWQTAPVCQLQACCTRNISQASVYGRNCILLHDM